MPDRYSWRSLKLKCESDLWAIAGLFAICVLTRTYAIPASLWEWDDINFARAIHEFNIPAHSPHPPGFPVFVAMCRVANAFLSDDHSAIVAVNLVFAFLLGPVLYLLFRELLEDRLVAFGAALLTCFAPVLWVHSSIARSDGPTLGLGLISMLLILKGRRSDIALISGCALLGIAIGVRVTVLPLVGPIFLLVIVKRLRAREIKPVLLCALALAACVLVWYVPMVIHTTWSAYQRAMKIQSEYVWRNDPIWVPEITLEKRFASFFLRVWGAEWIAQVIYALGLVGLICLLKWNRKAAYLMLLAFAPYFAFTFLFNTPMGAIVYSMPYLPLFTGLAACGLLLPSRFARRLRRELAIGGMAFVVFLTVAIGSWSVPLIRILRNQPSPPVRACEYLKQNLSSRDDVLYFDKLFTPHVTYYLGDKQTQELNGAVPEPGNLIDASRKIGHTFRLTTDAPAYLGASSAQHFNWPPGPPARRLHTLSIGRYFDAWVTDVSDVQNIRFLSGWHPIEAGGSARGSERSRLMDRRGSAALLATAERMMLHLRAQALNAGNSSFVLRLSNREIARFTAETTSIDRTFSVIPDLQRLWETLTIELDAPKENREPALRVFELSWTPDSESKRIDRQSNHFLGDGWYDIERQDQAGIWRWTREKASVHLPAIEGDGRLELSVTALEDNWPLEIQIAGQTLRRRTVGTSESILTYEVPLSLHKELPNDLVIVTKTKLVEGETRPLGVRVKYLTWTPSNR